VSGGRPLSPMMTQYRRIKDEHPSAIVFFRLGDFYETFFDDAATLARELEITLTSREAGRGRRVPMAGIPHHAAEGYIARLLDRGYRVAICEQVEDPAKAKGLVRREVTRVVTPGTTVDGRSLEAGTPNYLAVAVRHGEAIGLGLCDFSAGDFRVTELAGGAAEAALLDELSRSAPREVLLASDLAARESLVRAIAGLELPEPRPLEDCETSVARASQELCRHLGTVSLEAFGLIGRPAATLAAHALLSYLRGNQLELAHLAAPRYTDRQGYMLLSQATRRHLELVVSARDQKRGGSLLWAIDKTLTAMGGRLLREWVLSPLTDLSAVEARQQAIARLVGEAFARAEIRKQLADCPDLARLTGRAGAGVAGPRDLAAIGRALELLPKLCSIIHGLADGGDLGVLEQARHLLAAQCELTRLAEMLGQALAASPPAGLQEGGIFRDGYDAEIDRLRDLRRGGRGWLAEYEAAERSRTGIRSLRVGYNRVFGYYIEVTRPNLDQVPPEYTRRQTLASGERFVTPELKQREEEILSAEERLYAREYELYCDLRATVAAHSQPLLAVAAALANIDCLAGLAELAAERGYVRPEISAGDRLLIEAGRHPVLELTLEQGFVPNDLDVGGDGPEVLVITGPNMAGKSTYLRQAALIVIMAQIGSFVPARRAEIGLVDRVFTRIGAHDDLAAGQSTFMVEMQEVALILRHATAKSLVILDEVGRGTSTFDGISLARAVVEHLAGLACRTLFATHYHELIAMAGLLANVANYSTTVLDQGGEIVFPHKITPGGADRSYGIEVARLAGLPAAVIAQAKAHLAEIEAAQSEVAAAAGPGRPVEGGGERDDPHDSSSQAAGSRRGSKRIWPSPPQQISFFEPPGSPVLEEIRAVDLASTTPLEALCLLSAWQEQLRRKDG